MYISSAQTTTDLQNVKYEIITGATTKVVSNGTLPTGNINMPETIDINGTSCDVIEIGFQAFVSNTNIKGINLSNKITSIGQESFHGCTNLTNSSPWKDFKSISTSYNTFNATTNNE